MARPAKTETETVAATEPAAPPARRLAALRQADWFRVAVVIWLVLLTLGLGLMASLVLPGRPEGVPGRMHRPNDDRLQY